ncbi:putative RNA-binding Zn ribbon-like protein [Sphingomonas kyeonggiensis]|uniref:CGNR zinc finger domain-containing protein n=1 Tax=Sphingomonas kyeonggiensis TaxID=1268553 RepID=UPI002783CB3F|nr:ABATE domain-containing protein [Sphingomonas kyeonggiensis]MDQ0252346.1 putative RNA-binding Zn ribbon-like protein [Sphingomonas kyeonggiensis]
MPLGTPAMFLADARGLDFLNSVATPVDVPVDWIGDGRGLVDWLKQSGLVPEAQLEEIVARAMPGELDRVADQARDLREWFRGFVKRHMGRPLGGDALDALAPVNRLLERDETYRRIVMRDGHVALEAARRWRSPESLLLPIGEAIAETVVSEDFAQVKACQGHDCTLIFADHTRSRARRWCSMAVCGNRAKVTAHRARQRSAAG